MKKGIRGHDIRANGLENIALTAKENGIGYLQLVLERSIDGFKTGDFTEENAKTIKSRLGDCEVAILGSYINPSNPDDELLETDIKKFEEKIKYASILNPVAVGTETGIYKSGMTDTEEAYDRVLNTLKKIVAVAEEYGVNVGIEGVHFFVINTPKKMRRLIDDLKSDKVKVIFDPVNYINGDNYIGQDEMIKEMFTLLADRICVIHAKDFTVENGEFKMANPMEGMFNYKLLFEKLNEYNLDIPIICEGINEEAAVVAFEKMQKLQ